MSDETDNERTDRIREAQIHDRARSSSKKPNHNVTQKKSTAPKKVSKPSYTTYSNKSEASTPSSSWLQLPLGATRDIAIGLAYGLIPTLFVVIFLPGAFKLLAVVILAIAGTVGYLLGASTA